MTRCAAAKRGCRTAFHTVRIGAEKEQSESKKKVTRQEQGPQPPSENRHSCLVRKQHNDEKSPDDLGRGGRCAGGGRRGFHHHGRRGEIFAKVRHSWGKAGLHTNAFFGTKSKPNGLGGTVWLSFLGDIREEKCARERRRILRWR